MLLNIQQYKALEKFAHKNNYKDSTKINKIDFRDGTGSCYLYSMATFETTYGSGYDFSLNTLHGFKHEHCNFGGHGQHMRSEPKVVNEFLDIAREFKFPGYEIIKDSDYLNEKNSNN